MRDLFNFVFDRWYIFLFIGSMFYIYIKYKALKEESHTVQEKFKERLYPYLDERFKKYKNIVMDLLDEYLIEEIQIELKRIDKIIEPGIGGTLNNYVDVSNKINKLKLNSKLDLNRFPKLDQINSFQTFTTEEIESIDNGLEFARKEYNTLAFRYNEKALEFPMQYLVSILQLPSQYILFDTPKKDTYSNDFEEFEEEEPEIDSLANLNKQLMRRENVLLEDLPKKKKDAEIVIEHSDSTIKPSINLDDLNKDSK